ncbi:MAG: hypothetical protein JSS02_10525 [Planctomycetes bacterium]|nr:hypothetical protein [Planctomycetota bacterium]
MSLTSLALAGAPAIGLELDDEVLPDESVKVAAPNVYSLVFGRDISDSVEAGKLLEGLLLQKTAIVDRICGLTDAQKKKLVLSSRGDIKRILDGVEEIGTRMRLVDPKMINALGQEARSLLRSLTVPGLPVDRLLFDKALESTLTVEQLAKYEPLRAVNRVGGLVKCPLGGPEVFIDLNGTTFADDGLEQVKSLTELISLHLGNTHVTDSGLEHLTGLTALQDLLLNNTHITGAGLKHLQGLSALKRLGLDSTQVSDADLEHLKGMTGLQMLSINATKVTDSGLAHLEGLGALQSLRIMNTQVTNSGLKNLKRLKNLKSLYLRNTLVTDAAIAELQRTRPELKIIK